MSNIFSFKPKQRLKLDPLVVPLPEPQAKAMQLIDEELGVIGSARSIILRAINLAIKEDRLNVKR